MADPADIDVFTALANPVRRDLLVALQAGPLAAGALATLAEHRFQVRRPAVSEHLQVLRRARLVREERQGRVRLYHLEPAPLRTAQAWLAPFTAFWQGRLDTLGDLLDDVASSSSSSSSSMSSTSSPTSTTHDPEDVVKGPGDRFFNDGEMGYGGRGNFPRGNTYVLGVYVPEGYKA